MSLARRATEGTVCNREEIIISSVCPDNCVVTVRTAKWQSFLKTRRRKSGKNKYQPRSSEKPAQELNFIVVSVEIKMSNFLTR